MQSFVTNVGHIIKIIAKCQALFEDFFLAHCDTAKTVMHDNRKEMHEGSQAGIFVFNE